MKQISFYYMNMLIMLIMVVLMILIGVSFLTLMERKMLSYIQIRKGPNKVGYFGVIQPFSDAIKLLTKESFSMLKLNYLYYYFSPIFMLVLILMMWMIYPFKGNLLSMDLGLIYLMSCFSLGAYGLMMTGWSSNSSYSMLGSIRSLSQSISYEVSLSIILLILIMLVESFNLMDYLYMQYNFWFMFYLSPLMLVFLMSLMAELNRTPFDFSEGESELVSGFNVEYMSGGFILIFLSEYLSILFLSFLFSLLFLGGDYINFMFYIKLMILVFMVIWIRGSFPRFRYDLLMYLCWMIILPFVLNYFMIILFMKEFNLYEL